MKEIQQSEIGKDSNPGCPTQRAACTRQVGVCAFSGSFQRLGGIPFLSLVHIPPTFG